MGVRDERISDGVFVFLERLTIIGDICDNSRRLVHTIADLIGSLPWPLPLPRRIYPRSLRTFA